MGGNGNLCSSLEATIVVRGIIVFSPFIDEAKANEAIGFGAHQLKSIDQLADQAGRFYLVINTVNKPLNWYAVMVSLAPRGKLQQLCAVLDPIHLNAFNLIMARRCAIPFCTRYA